MNKRFLYSLFVLGMLTACQSEEPGGDVPVEAQEVAVGAALEQHNDFSAYTGKTTRYAYDLVTPEPTRPLIAYVWASTTSCSFPHFDNTGDGSASSGYAVSKHAFTTFYSGYSALAKNGKRALNYPINGKLTPEVYFVGLAPASDDGVPDNDIWTHASYTETSYTFTGKEDVMYAPQVSAHYAGDVPVLHFYHLLTHLRFILKCEGATQDDRDEVSYGWGKIRNITLTKQNNGADDPRNKVTIDLSKIASNLTQVETRSTFTNDAATYLALFMTGSDNYFPQNPLFDEESRRVAIPANEDGEEMAYVLCAPVTATAGTVGALTDEYTLTLNTEHRSDVTIPIDLMVGPGTYFSGSTIGCEFLVTLTFRFGKVIATATAISDWSSQGGQTSVDIKDE